MVNGFDTLVITKLDVLDHLEEIPVCVGYRLDGAEITEMPATYRALEAIEPVYRKLPGWHTSTRGIARYDDCRSGRARICSFWKKAPASRVGGVSTGPERNETIIRMRQQTREADLSLDERVADHVTNYMMRIFDPAHMLLRHLNIQPGHLAQLASVTAG